jgi:hypothetical protein
VLYLWMLANPRSCLFLAVCMFLFMYLFEFNVSHNNQHKGKWTQLVGRTTGAGG